MNVNLILMTDSELALERSLCRREMEIAHAEHRESDKRLWEARLNQAEYEQLERSWDRIKEVAA